MGHKESNQTNKQLLKVLYGKEQTTLNDLQVNAIRVNHTTQYSANLNYSPKFLKLIGHTAVGMSIQSSNVTFLR